MSKQMDTTNGKTAKADTNTEDTKSNDNKLSKRITKTQVMGRNRGAVLRLQQDYINLNKDPVPYIRAEPLPWNILEWHYVINGPENSPYFGGMYHGTLVFTQQYPFKPPSIYIRTPNGRFQTNRRLCLSISDYHPDEWNPAWSVSSILTGLLSFMLEDSAALGTIITPHKEKLQLAYNSLEYNLKDQNFVTLFPDVCKEINETLAKRESDEAKENDSTKDGSKSGMKDGVSGSRSRSSGNIDENGGFPHLILIICFCLGALIFHHAYNLEQMK